jgi:hypothetical protein
MFNKYSSREFFLAKKQLKQDLGLVLHIAQALLEGLGL